MDSRPAAWIAIDENVAPVHRTIVVEVVKGNSKSKSSRRSFVGSDFVIE